jgi:hypothetical protein
MTFSLVNTWSVGDKFTSAQANNIATMLTKALDKSLAGDTLSGVITMANTAAIIASNDGNITADAADGISANAANSITSNVSAGISTTVPGGIAPSSGGTITDGGIAGGIVITAASGLQTTAAGGIELAGGSGDWVTYATPRSISTIEITSAMVAGDPTGWFIGTGSGVESTANAGNILGLWPHKFINGSANGAHLASITIRMGVGTSHSGGGVPLTPPTFNMFRQQFPSGGPAISTSMFSTGAQSFWPVTALGGISTPGSGAAWTNSGNLWSITFAPDTNNLIDTTQYGYHCELVDEQGTNALTGNVYYSISFAFNNIVSSAL